MGATATNWTEGFMVPTGSLAAPWDTFDQLRSWQLGLQNRADLQQLRTQAGNAELAVKFRRNQLFPSLDLVGSYGRQGVSLSQPFPPLPPEASSSEAFNQLWNGDAPRNMIGFIFSVPLSRRAERGAYRTSQALEEQARLYVKQQEELVLREISDAVYNARSSLERTTSARRSAGYAAEALRAEEQKLQGGASDIYIVLQLQADLASARLGELEARRDYNQAVSQLRHAEGTLLEDSGLILQFD
jgi:outer membrane protein TolC